MPCAGLLELKGPGQVDWLEQQNCRNSRTTVRGTRVDATQRREFVTDCPVSTPRARQTRGVGPGRREDVAS